MLEFSCPHCGKSYEAGDDKSGEMIECAGCGNIFHAPSQKCCPNCGDFLGPGSVVCIKCGYDFRRGRQVKTRVQTAEEEEKEAAPGWLRLLRLLHDLVPGLFRPVIVVAFMLFIVIALFVAWIGLFVLSLGAILGGIAICSGALMIYAQGVAFLLAGEFQLLKSAMVDFDETQMWILGVVSLGPLVVLFFLMVYISRAIG